MINAGILFRKLLECRALSPLEIILVHANRDSGRITATFPIQKGKTSACRVETEVNAGRSIIENEKLEVVPSLHRLDVFI